jgi:hypothetical protein
MLSRNSYASDAGMKYTENVLQKLSLLIENVTLSQCWLWSYMIWETMPCIPRNMNGRFGGICRPHLQCWRVSQARNQEDEGYMFLGKIDWLSMDYMALYFQAMEIFWYLHSINLLKTSNTCSNVNILHSAHTVYMRFPSDSHIKLRFFP